MKKRTCHELGVCNGRPTIGTCRHDTEKLPCGGFFFAPGEVEMYEPQPLLGRAGRLLLVFIALVAVLIVIAAALGHFGRTGGLW